jgi:hypothetical protein
VLPSRCIYRMITVSVEGGGGDLRGRDGCNYSCSRVVTSSKSVFASLHVSQCVFIASCLITYLMELRTALSYGGRTQTSFQYLTEGPTATRVIHHRNWTLNDAYTSSRACHVQFDGHGLKFLK